MPVAAPAVVVPAVVRAPVSVSVGVTAEVVCGAGGLFGD